MERRHLISVVAGIAAMTSATAWAADDSTDGQSYDGLTRVENAAADILYVLPDADFTVYKRFIILEPYVAFRRNWQRDQNRNRSTATRVSDRDMQNIKSGMTELFNEVFTQRLTASGFQIAEEPAEDVMILRPAIVNLDITAPDIPSAARTRTYVANAGSGTLFLELYDSVTGQLLARAVDSRRARNSVGFQWATSVSNRAEARNAMNVWAGMLVDSLNAVHTKTP
jgi:hypothetical protein